MTFLTKFGQFEAPRVFAGGAAQCKRDLYHNTIKIIIMGVVAKGTTCSVDGCDNMGVRSLNVTKVESAGLRITIKGKRAVLCKEHYREYKKESKDDRGLERARWG